VYPERKLCAAVEVSVVIAPPPPTTIHPLRRRVSLYVCCPVCRVDLANDAICCCLRHGSMVGQWVSSPAESGMFAH